ncbi:hypothetical protein F5B20DRAFT_440622 [Whalleya microplaca]|nr:hypothetical protein F5B20DRAFT_440622 [Whalleya microplaca]
MTDKESENIVLLKSLMGGGDTGTQGRSNVPSHHCSTPRNSADQSIRAIASGYRTPSPTSSRGSDCRKVLGPQHSAVNVPSSYQTYEFPEMADPGHKSSSRSCDFCGRSSTSLEVQRSNPSTPSNTTLYQAQRSFVVPTSASSTGLQALFQQPVRLKPSSEHRSSGPGYAQNATIYATSTTPRKSIPGMPSMESLRSHDSRFSIPDQQNCSETQVFRPHKANHSPPKLSYTDLTGKLTNQSAPMHTMGKPTVTSDVQSHRQSNGLSKLFTYHPCLVKQSPSGLSNLPAPDSTVLCELEGEIPASQKPTEAETMRTRSASASSPVSPHESLFPHETTTKSQSLESGSLVSEPGKRRDMVDSEAWQRRTKMFQMEDPDGYLRAGNRRNNKEGGDK